MAQREQPRILIVTANFGAGHISVSNSLKSAFAARGVDDVSILDFYELVSPLFNKMSRFVYRTGTTWTPALYGAAYKKVDSLSMDSWVHAAADRFGRDELTSEIKQAAPDIVIFTYPAPAGVMQKLKNNGSFRGMLATVITDYTVHMSWLHNPVDLYLAAADHVRDILIDRGVAPASIEVTGIPIDRSFEGAARVAPPETGSSRVIFAAHAYRTSDALAITRALLRGAPDSEIVVLYRRNEILARRLAGFKNGRNLRPLSYAKSMRDLMSQAGVLVSKAGGLTMTEAMVSGLPVVVYRPVPGQEEENAVFMRRAGAALVANTPKQLEEAVRRVLSDPAQGEGMRRAASRLVWPDSADRAAAAVLARYAIANKAIRRGETNGANPEADSHTLGELRSGS